MCNLFTHWEIILYFSYANTSERVLQQPSFNFLYSLSSNMLLKSIEIWLFSIKAIEIIQHPVYNVVNNVVFIAMGGCFIMPDVNILLEKAVAETAFLDDGEVFLLRDLFKGYEWNRVALKDRLLLGTLFLNRVGVEKLGIEVLVKTSSGQQKYKIARGETNA